MSPVPAAARAAVVATTTRYLDCSAPRSLAVSRHDSVGVASSIPSGAAFAFASSPFPVGAAYPAAGLTTIVAAAANAAPPRTSFLPSTDHSPHHRDLGDPADLAASL